VNPQDIEHLVGCYDRVLRPLKRKPSVEPEPCMVFWDTEYDEQGLISAQFGWYCDGELETRIFYLDELSRERLRELIYSLVDPAGRVYLISHFSQSELQHLTDFWELDLNQINKALYARDGDIIFIDSFSHFPTSLERIGESTGVPKLDIGDWITRMRELLRQDRTLFEAYALRDVEVLAAAWTRRRDYIQGRFGVDLLNCYTTAHTSITAFRHRYLSEPVEPVDTGYMTQNKKGGNKWRQYHTRVYDGSRDKRHMALLAYWGGRREAFNRGVLEEPVEVWDVASMYPHMALLPLPTKDTQWIYSRNLDELLSGESYVKAGFSFPPSEQYPCLPMMDTRFPKLVFPQTGTTYCTTHELRLATSLGCGFSSVEGWVFHPGTREETHPLGSFMTDCMELKKDSERDTVEYEVAKLMMNSIIGKFMQRSHPYSFEAQLKLLRELGDPETVQAVIGKRSTRERLREAVKVSQYWAPEWSSLISGRSRAVIGDFMHTSKALTGHTDSVIIKKGSNVSCPSLDLLRSLGSNLVHEADYDGEGFWICRSACYSPIRLGKAVKPTHHGYPVNRHRDFGEIIEHNLVNPEKINECSKRSLVTPRTALRTGKKVGVAETKTYNINWGWDQKRKLTGEVDLWENWSDTVPWGSMDELLTHVGIIKTRRPDSIRSGKIEVIKQLKQLGLSNREIAKRLGIGHSTVDKYVDARGFLNKQ